MRKIHNIMSKSIKTLALFAFIGLAFMSCRKEYDVPPIANIPVGTVYTIDDILAMESGTVFNDSASVYGIVTADEVSGNLYKQAFIQDRATGAALELHLDATSGVRIGDSIRVYLEGVTYMKYNNLPQLSGFGPDGHIIILANNVPIEPELTTIANILAGHHTAQLIRLENVMFGEKGVFADLNASGNRTLIDPTNPTQSVIVRTSNYANFAKDSIPQGSGNLIAIASVYNSTWQLLLRTVHELEFEGYNPTPGEVQTLPYFQSFGTSFGTYTPYSVEGDQEWVIDYSTASMSGYENATGNNYANEDWLISAPVAITDVQKAKIGVTYIARHFNNLNSGDVTVQVSSDYEAGSDPTTATWTEVPMTWVEVNNWTDFNTAEASLNQFIGQTVVVAVKYVSTNDKAGSLEIQSIIVQEGEPGGVTPPTPPPTQLEGDGTRNNPYTATDVMLLNHTASDGNYYWVTGYIVGFVSTDNNQNVYTFNANANIKSNILVGKAANTNTESECIPVQLPGGDIRNGVNLQDNPGNFQKHILLYGTLESYFSVAAMKNVVYAEIDGNGIGTDPDIVHEDYLYETLLTQASFNTFTEYSVTGSQKWTFSSQYGAVMNGYDSGTSYANEDWFISPAVDLSNSTNPILTFDHARGNANVMNVGVNEGYYKVYVSNDYNGGAPHNRAQWTELTGVVHGTQAWQYVSSGELTIPAEFKTSNCRIAFRYLSIDGASATWEVKNVRIAEQ